MTDGGKTLLDSLYAEHAASSGGGTSLIDALYAEADAASTPSTMAEMTKAFIKPIIETPGYLADALATVGDATRSLLAPPGAGAASRQLSEDLRGFAETNRNIAEAAAPTDPRMANAGLLQRTAVGTAGAAGSMVPIAMTGAATGGGGAVGLGSAMLSSQMGAEAQAAGADEDTQMQMRLAGAGIGVLSAVVPMRLLGAADRASKGLLKNYLVEQAVAAPTFAGQQVLSNLVAKYNYDEHRAWHAGLAESTLTSIPFAAFGAAMHGRAPKAPPPREIPAARIEANLKDPQAQEALSEFVRRNAEVGHQAEGAKVYLPSESDNPFVQLAYKSGAPVYYVDAGRKMPRDGFITDNGVLVIDAMADPVTQARIVLMHEVGHQAITAEMQRGGGTMPEAAERLIKTLPPDLAAQARAMQEMQHERAGIKFPEDAAAEETYAGAVEAYAGVSFHAAMYPRAYEANLKSAQTGNFVANTADSVLKAIGKLGVFRGLEQATFEYRRLKALRDGLALTPTEHADHPLRVLQVGQAIGKVLEQQFKPHPYVQPETGSFDPFGVEPTWPEPSTASIAAEIMRERNEQFPDLSQGPTAREARTQRGLNRARGRLGEQGPPPAVQGPQMDSAHPLLRFKAQDVEAELYRTQRMEEDAAHKSLDKKGPGYTEAFLDLRRRARDFGNPEQPRAAEQLQALYDKMPPEQVAKIRHPGKWSVEELRAALDVLEARAAIDEMYPGETTWEKRKAEMNLREKLAEKAATVGSEPRFHVSPVTAEADIPGLGDAGGMKLISDWIGARQWGVFEAGRGAREHYRAVEKIIGETGWGEAIKARWKDQPAKVRLEETLKVMRAWHERAIAESYASPADIAVWLTKLKSDNPEAYNLWHASEKLKPELQAIVKSIAAENVVEGKKALYDSKLNPSGILTSVIEEGYHKRIYERDPETKTSGPDVGKFRPGTSASRQRTYRSVFEALANGKKLKTWDPIESQKVMRKDLTQAIADKNFRRLLIKSELASVSRQPGFEPVDYQGFKQRTIIAAAKAGREYSELELFRQNGFNIDADGNVFADMPLYVKEGLANGINAVVGESGLKKTPTLGAIASIQAQVKGWYFVGSMFNILDGIVRYTTATPLSTMRDMSPVAAYRTGGELIAKHDPIVKMLIEHGGLTMDVSPDATAVMGNRQDPITKLLEKHAQTRRVLNVLSYMRDRHFTYQYHELMPRLKLMTAVHEMARLTRVHEAALKAGKIAPEELAAQAGAMANELYGGLNLERMGRGKTTQDIARLTLLAPDWTEANVKLLSKMVQKGDIGAAYRAMWARILARGVTATVLWNVAMAALGDKDDPRGKGIGYRFERAWKSGGMRWLDLDVTPIYHALGGDPTKLKYLSLINHYNDVFRWLNFVDIDESSGMPIIRDDKGPVSALKNKLSPAASLVIEALSGQDWAGRGYTSMAELTGTDDKGVYQTTSLPHHIAGMSKGGQLGGQLVSHQAKKGTLGPSRTPSFLLKQGVEAAPIPVQFLQQWWSGQIDAFDFLTRSSGFLTSSVDTTSSRMRR